MHGSIHAELQKFVIARHGREAWQKLLKQSGLGPKSYLASQQYPDGDIVALVTAAAAMTGTPVGVLLEQFGEFIVPGLLSMYRSLLDPSWRTLDVLEHTEATIHSVVRMRNAGAAPPRLQFRRVGPEEVRLSYRSERKMCEVAMGIMRGVAREFGESIRIDESTCMQRGAPSCEMAITLVARGSARQAS